MFYVGQKVVCVDVDGLYSAPWNQLKLKSEYTIIALSRSVPGNVGTLYVEVAEGPRSTNEYPAYYARRFRPAVERKTSIEIFTRMLNPSKERETV